MFDQGYIRLPRSLLNHPTISGLKHIEFRMFIFLLENMCFKCCQQDAHGNLIDLKPGQYMTTERQFAKICNTDSSRVRRFFERLENAAILKQEVKHNKHIITITHKSICELLKDGSEAESEAKVKQKWSKSEAQKKKVRKKEGKNNIPSSEDAVMLLKYFNTSLQSNIPEIKDSLSEDARSFDRLLKKHSINEIKQVIDFAHYGFWKAHVHTPSYLNEKFPTLLVQSNQGAKEHVLSKAPFQIINGAELDESSQPKYESQRKLSG